MPYIGCRVSKPKEHPGHRIVVESPGIKFEFDVLDGKISGPVPRDRKHVGSEKDTLVMARVAELMAGPFVLEQIEKCRRLEALGL